MIVSRTAELARLDALLAALRGGDGGALVVHGEAGIGKTTLLDALVERCGDVVTVLRACGAETEAELAFSALADLLGPVLGAARRAAGPQQAAALTGALALGPPVPGDRLAVCVADARRAAAGGAGAARCSPWSTTFSGSTRRRASASSTSRAARVDRWRSCWPRATRCTRPSALRLPDLPLGPLDDDRGGRAAAARGRPELAPPVAAAIAQAAAGNPLALVELPATLTADQRAGVAALELPLAPGGRLQRAFARPGRRRSAAGAAGAADRRGPRRGRAGSGDRGRVHAGDRRGVGRPRPRRMRPAGAACRGQRDLRTSARPRRRCIGRRPQPSAASAHAALAGALPRRRPPRVAPGGGRGRAGRGASRGELERRRRPGRGAPCVRPARSRSSGPRACRPEHAGSRAAACSRPARRRPPRRCAGPRARPARGGGRADRGAGASRARPSTCAAGCWSGAGRRRPRRRACSSARPSGCTPEDHVLAARRCSPTPPTARPRPTPTSTPRARPARRRACSPRAGDATERAPVLTTLGWVLMLRGNGAGPARCCARRSASLDGLDPLGPHWPWLHILLAARSRRSASSSARAERRRAVRARAAMRARCTPLGGAGWSSPLTSRSGSATGRRPTPRPLEAIRLAERGRPARIGGLRAVDARPGPDRCARTLEQESRAAPPAALEHRGVRPASRAAALRARRARVPRAGARTGRRGDRASSSRRAAARGLGHEEPTIVPWAPDLCRGLRCAAAVTDDARRVLARSNARRLDRQPVAAAAAARCRGLLDDDFDAAFAAALAFDDRRPMPFERARTLLAFGRRLHRARRRAAARDHLARRWTDSSGCTRTRGPAQAQPSCAPPARAAGRRGDGALTPQELRVAAAVQRGASNREIAAELFLSPQDGRVPPAPDLPQARRSLEDPARRRARGEGHRLLGGQSCSGVPEELPHHRAVRLAPGHDLKAVPGEGRRDPGEQVAGMRRHGCVDRIGLQGRGARRGRRRQGSLDQGVHDAKAAVR